jgi:hypothetical protein
MWKNSVQQVTWTDHIITSMVAKNAYSCLVMIGIGHQRPISLKVKEKEQRRKLMFMLVNNHNGSLLRAAAQSPKSETQIHMARAGALKQQP